MLTDERRRQLHGEAQAIRQCLGQASEVVVRAALKQRYQEIVEILEGRRIDTDPEAPSPPTPPPSRYQPEAKREQPSPSSGQASSSQTGAMVGFPANLGGEMKKKRYFALYTISFMLAAYGWIIVIASLLNLSRLAAVGIQDFDLPLGVVLFMWFSALMCLGLSELLDLMVEVEANTRRSAEAAQRH